MLLVVALIVYCQGVLCLILSIVRRRVYILAEGSSVLLTDAQEYPLAIVILNYALHYSTPVIYWPDLLV